ncbi:MAG: hypothetical protein WCI41_04505 [bacterium]
MHIENVNLQALRELVENHPLRQIRGRFRVSVPFVDWDFCDQISDVPKKIEGFQKFLSEEKPSLILVTEDGAVLGKLEITTHHMFDGDIPEYPNEIYFILPEKVNGDLELKNPERLLLILNTNDGWPNWDEFGEFILQI